MKTENYKITKNPYGGWDVRNVHEAGIVKQFATFDMAENFLRDLYGESVMPAAVTIDLKENVVETERATNRKD